MQTVNVKNIDNKHSEWKSSLSFYKDELGVFTKQLTEVAEKNTGNEVMQMVDHFQNQFLVQAENMDILKHDIDQHISMIAEKAIQRAGHIDKDEMITHTNLQERFETQALILKGLKDEFRKFLSKVM